MKSCITKALLRASISCALMACAGQQQDTKEPMTTPEPSATPPVAEEAPKGPGIEAEMQFEDKRDTEQKADRTPPPTPAYKPTSKSKSANAQ